VRYYYKPTDGAGAFMINRHSIINTVLELASLSCGPLSFEKPGLTHLKTIFSFRSHASTVATATDADPLEVSTNWNIALSRILSTFGKDT
jgi:hypothetical protein